MRYRTMTVSFPDLLDQPIVVTQQSEVDRVYHQLREWIITSELTPGTFLSEPDLAERCGTSRTPVREALSRLVQDGWVTSIHRKGFQVRPITLKDVSDLYIYRRLFETHACERAAGRATAEQIAQLEQIVAIEEKARETADRLLCNEQFHMGIALHTENQRMIGQMRQIMAYLRRLGLITMIPDEVTHRQILDAIKTGDGTLAKNLMGEHMDFALEGIVRSVLSAP
jgi:DNA-binding GntR family transcriptional regulator